MSSHLKDCPQLTNIVLETINLDLKSKIGNPGQDTITFTVLDNPHPDNENAFSLKIKDNSEEIRLKNSVLLNRISRISDDNPILLLINSTGGSLSFSRDLIRILQRKQSVTAVNFLQTSSAAFALFMSATKGQRILLNKNVVAATHRTSFHTQDSPPKAKFQEDFPEDSKAHKTLKELNDWALQFYKSESTTRIDDKCVHQCRSNKSKRHDAMTLLKLGWADAIANDNGTIIVREHDDLTRQALTNLAL